MMKAQILTFLFLSIAFNVIGQGLQIKSGDQFPDIPIRSLINSPVTVLQLSKPIESKIYILNFWGTWCSPCIPEMDALDKLQVLNSKIIQVVAISDESKIRLMKYLKSKPSKIWLASDTSAIFYKLFALRFVGQSAIVNSKGKVVAIVKTDSINQQMINQLVKGLTVKSSAELKEKPINVDNDLFGVDSTLNKNFTLRSYMIGKQSMSIGYGRNSVYSNRRITFFNSSAEAMYREAYGISSSKQLAYEIPEKLVSDFDNKKSLYCLDLLIEGGGRDSLYQELKRKLAQEMSVKARIDMREMPVYALVNKNFHQAKSSKTELSYGFSGMGYDGTGATLSDFASDYLSNEFDLPVVDETGLVDRYDIKTNVDMRTRASILKSINDIGFELIKKTKSMRVLVFYK